MTEPDRLSARASLERFLTTDPRDVGCDEALRVLHVYVELKAAGDDPELHWPGVSAHLLSCGPCDEDYHGLLAAVLGT
ncbi:hypothetical protein ABT404_17660 [Streptomyces hyaluromycini]|uniref:Zf-HC2 domain-containing protein n=1 Tax=Streptomyces hyaluromycini TaxID=1377993 RepID=A0ABV1WWX7_9ACTN|nr:hypothetical protein [Streptomyces hyaluromycini]